MICVPVLASTIVDEGSFLSPLLIVHPLLKKLSVDPSDLSNYRPISALNVVSKLLE